MNYENEIAKFDLYNTKIRELVRNSSEDELVLLIIRMMHFIGLAGEVGELGEKIKKTVRDKGGKFETRSVDRAKELGDIEWYLTRLESDEGYAKDEILQLNFDKLSDRHKRNVVQGEGDNR